MQPIQRLEHWLITSHSAPSGRLYTAKSFRPLFPDLSQGAYRALLHRAEKRGLLERVCHNVYQYPGDPDTSGLILFRAAALLRASHFNYISLETVLSDAGLISQVPIAWITLVSTGRSAEVTCGRFGTIEFIHTERSIGKISDQLTYDPDRHLFRASPRLALSDMKRFNRSTFDLVKDLENDPV